MKQTTLTLLHKKQLTKDVFQLILAGDCTAITAPGQFVNLQIHGLYLRRPISVCDWSAGTVTLICRNVGKGTDALCNAKLGTQFDTLVGLGNGYNIDDCHGKPILVGGGVGVPPLYGLAKAMIAKGITPHVALGFRNDADCFYVQEFYKLGCLVSVATEDGSFGRKGFVTGLVEQTDCDYVFTCGPEPMLKALFRMEQLTDGQFSFEERMGCGFGACMGCTCETITGYKRICKDGPIMRKGELIW